MQSENAAYPLPGSRKGFCLGKASLPCSIISAAPSLLALKTSDPEGGCRPRLTPVLCVAAADERQV